MLPWLPIYSCFVMRGTLLCLFLMINRLMLLMHLTLHTDIWTRFKTLIMFILTLRLVIYTLQSSNLIKPISLIFEYRSCNFRLALSISNDIVSTKIYDKRNDFDFEIVNFPFLDGDVPRSTSYGVYISQLIRFARAFSYFTDSQ